MSSITTVAHGDAALQTLRDVLESERSGNVFAPAIVLVQTPAQAVYVRAGLARFGGVGGVEVLPTSQFVRRLADDPLLSVRRRPARSVEFRCAIQAELLEAEGQLGTVSDHASTLRRLVDLAQTLRGIPEDVVEKIVHASNGLSAECLQLIQRANQRLEHVLSAEELVEIALEVLEGAPAESFGILVSFNPRPQTALEGRFLASLSGRADSHIVAGLTGHGSIDKDYQRLLNGWGVHLPITSVETNLGTRFDVSDPTDEIDVALRELLALAGSGVSLNSMALLYPHADPYASVCQQRLTTAGIPFCGPDIRSLSDSMVVRTLLRLLDLPHEGLDRSAVMGFLRSAPIHDKDATVVPADDWDRISRLAGVLSAESWTGRLDEYVDTVGSSLEPDELAALTTEVESLKQFVCGLGERLQQLSKVETWEGFVEWAKNAIQEYTPQNADWPEPERWAHGAVEQLLDGFVDLGSVLPDPTLEQFSSLVSSEMERHRFKNNPYGSGLLVASVAEAAGLSFEQVVVVGLSEGSFPRTTSEDPLLPDQLRAVAGRHLPPTAQSTSDDCWELAAALRGSRRPGILTFGRSELRSSRTRIWPNVIDPLIDRRETIDSHYQGVMHSGVPLSSEDFNLKELTLHAELGEPIESHPLAERDHTLAAGLRHMKGRRSGDMSSHVGLVNADNLDLDTRLFSPTALETYASCPRRYLFGRVLRISEQERPEEIEELSARDRGSLLHRILERFIGEAITAQTVPSPTVAWSEAEQERLFEIASEEVQRVSELGLSGGEVQTRISWRSLRTELRNFITNDNELRARYQCTPVAVESGFGFDGTDTFFSLANGKQIRLRGSVDRVDLTVDDNIIVIDYKTGSSRGFTKIEANPLDEGRRLQLPLYGSVMADRFEVTGEKLAMYWMTREAKQIRLDLTSGVESELESTVTELLNGISSGYFPAIPGDVVGFPKVTFENCTFCEFDRICPRDRQREWATMNPEQLRLRDLLEKGGRG